MLKKGLILLIISQKDIFQKEKTKKVISLIKDELDRKTMKEFVGLKAKTYRYLTDDNDESKKQKVQKMCNEKKTQI